MSRKTRTPKWLSILRKLYTYIGVSGLFTAIQGKWGISAEDMLFIVELYLAGAVAIQTICDTYYIKEEGFKPDPVNPKIKE